MDGINSATSALMAFSTKMNATANNIANSQTRGYQADRVNMAAQNNGGVVALASKDQTKGPVMPQNPGLPSGESSTQGSNVDLAREMTDLLQSRRGYQANAKVIGTLDQTKGTLLDIVK